MLFIVRYPLIEKLSSLIKTAAYAQEFSRLFHHCIIAEISEKPLIQWAVPYPFIQPFYK